MSRPGLSARADCSLNGQGLLVENQYSSTHVPYNASAGWETVAPSGITITGIYTVNDDATNIGGGASWWGEFYWDGGRSAQLTNAFATYGCCKASFSSHRIGWFFACARANGCSGFAAIAVGQAFVSCRGDARARNRGARFRQPVVPGRLDPRSLAGRVLRN